MKLNTFFSWSAESIAMVLNVALYKIKHSCNFPGMFLKIAALFLWTRKKHYLYGSEVLETEPMQKKAAGPRTGLKSSASR